ncbi:MAG: c-type cytochrome [Epsilonproteobacteria bacterium]|nr:c-type cytochrome [Campylobacterota bacterium]
MKQEVTKVVQELKPAINGAKLFSKCVACHGANAEKKALNKSHVIRGWSEEKIMTAFHGYKAGTYGSTMKGVMKAQIANFNEEELKALAKHISKL